jgi:dTDP-glucose 4,6-dehydratase
MKLLVTGGLGFIGSNFIKNILENYTDYNIINLDDERYGSNHLSLTSLKNSNNYKFVKGNICDTELCKKLVGESDIVINFAAESHVDRSILNSKPFMDSNIIGVHNILEQIKLHKKRLIQISTDEVFGSLENESADEKFKLNSSSPYASSKASAELIVNSYVKTYECDCIITRCTNNYGPHQFPEKLIPKTLLLAENNQKIPIYGTGKNIRDWIHVDDHCNAIVDVLHKGKTGESYNISANNEIDNITIVKKILSLMDKSEDLIEFVEDRPGHDFRYSLDSSKIRTSLNWSSKINFDKGIQKTIDWYLKNQEWWKNIEKNTFNATPWKK